MTGIEPPTLAHVTRLDGTRRHLPDTAEEAEDEEHGKVVGERRQQAKEAVEDHADHEGDAASVFVGRVAKHAAANHHPNKQHRREQSLRRVTPGANTLSVPHLARVVQVQVALCRCCHDE